MFTIHVRRIQNITRIKKILLDRKKSGRNKIKSGRYLRTTHQPRIKTAKRLRMGIRDADVMRCFSDDCSRRHSSNLVSLITRAKIK